MWRLLHGSTGMEIARKAMRDPEERNRQPVSGVADTSDVEMKYRNSDAGSA